LKGSKEKVPQKPHRKYRKKKAAGTEKKKGIRFYQGKTLQPRTHLKSKENHYGVLEGNESRIAG